MRKYSSIVILVALVVLSSCKQGSLLSKEKSIDVASTAAVSRLTPEQQMKFNYFYLEAIRMSESDHSTSAFELLQHCRRINPDAPEVDYSLSQFYSTLKDTSNVLRSMEAAVAKAPENTDYAEELAGDYVRYGHVDKSIAVYESLLNKRPDRSNLLDNLYVLYSQNKDYDKMISTLNRMEVIEGKNEKLSEEKFRIYVNQNKPKKAFEEMEALADKYPNDLRYRVTIGRMLLVTGREKDGLNVLRTVLKNEPDNTMAKMVFMDYYKEKGLDSLYNSMLYQVLTSKNTETADKINMLRNIVSDNERNGADSTKVIKLFRDVLTVSPNDADMTELLASYMILKKMPTDSVAPVLYRIITIAPEKAYARLQLIGYAWSAKNLDDVITLCRPALQYNPDEMPFYYYLGLAYYQKNMSDEALSTFQKGVSVITAQSDASIVSDFYAVMGDILHDKGRQKEAFAAYDSCLQWKDDNIGCLNNYAYYISLTGNDLGRAEQMSYKTVKAEPTNSTFLDTYAWILFLQKRYEAAKLYIDQALINNVDSSAVIIEHAGDIYALNKNIDKAVELWKRAADISKDNKLLIRKIKLKKYIRE